MDRSKVEYPKSALLVTSDGKIRVVTLNGVGDYALYLGMSSANHAMVAGSSSSGYIAYVGSTVSVNTNNEHIQARVLQREIDYNANAVVLCRFLKIFNTLCARPIKFLNGPVLITGVHSHVLVCASERDCVVGCDYYGDTSE